MGKIVCVVMLILLASLVSAESIFLSGYMEEGQTRVYEIDGGIYVINLLSVSDVREKAVFRLNDEMSKGIELKDSYVFNDGSEIVLRDLLINEAEDGKDEAYYYFYGTGKDTLPLTNVSMYAVEDLCNFDKQCLNETKDNCCYDCGCGEDKECLNNRCVATEVEEEEEDVEEVEAEDKVEVEENKVEGKKELSKGEKEKKAAYAMVGVIVFFAAIMLWFVVKKKRRRRIF